MFLNRIFRQKHIIWLKRANWTLMTVRRKENEKRARLSDSNTLCVYVYR